MKEKSIYIIYSQEKKSCTEVNYMVFTMENKTKMLFTMQRRDMAFTMEIMFSTEEWLGGGKVQFTFKSF